MAKGTKTPGAKNRIPHRKMLRLIDGDTGDVLAIIRWRPRGEVYVEHAKHIRPRVVRDYKA